MAITKQKKSEILEGLNKIFKEAKTVVFVNFHKLSVADATTLRSDLRKSGVNYLVAKKTLTKKAIADSKVGGEVPEMEGELALAYLAKGDDITSPARSIHDFGKTHKDMLSIMGGVFEGKLVNREVMTEIALIPSMQTLRAQFVNVINSPIQGLAMVLDQIAKSKV